MSNCLPRRNSSDCRLKRVLQLKTRLQSSTNHHEIEIDRDIPIRVLLIQRLYSVGPFSASAPSRTCIPTRETLECWCSASFTSRLTGEGTAHRPRPISVAIFFFVQLPPVTAGFPRMSMVSRLHSLLKASSSLTPLTSTWPYRRSQVTSTPQAKAIAKQYLNESKLI